MKLKSGSIRRRAAILLHARQAIDGSTAEALVADPDFEIRLVGVEALSQHGKALQEETIKSALTRQQARGLFALGYGSSGPPDDSYYQRYQQNRLSQLSEEELRRKVDGRTVFDELEVITLYEKYTHKCSAKIRANLADRFKGHFDRKLTLTAALLQYDASRLAEIQKLEDYVRNVLTSRTLDIFCAYTNGADLNLVRATVDNCDITSSKNILRFMGRHGDWTDVPRILTLYQRRYSNAINTLFIPSDEWTRPTAQALYAIGKSRLADLLQLEIDNSVRRALILQFSQKDVAKLSDGYLSNLLNDADDQFRKGLALKCALSLTQARVRKLLDKYTKQDGQRYYNSIHWLDLGASMTRDTVKSVASFELPKFA